MYILEKASEVSDWLGQINGLDLGAKKIEVEVLEFIQGLRDDLLIINSEILNQLDKKQFKIISDVSAIIIFNLKNEVITNLPTNIINQVNSSTSPELFKVQLNKTEALLRENIRLKSQLVSMNMELVELIEGVETQLFRVKNVYEKMAPKRLEEFNGFNIYSKHGAGDSFGGEFFDMFTKNDKTFIMMSSTTSYLASSLIMQLFSELKQLDSINSKEEESFVETVKEQISILSASKNKEITTQVLTCILDTKTMTLEGHMLGNFKLISSDLTENFESSSSLASEFETTEFTHKISRAQRLMFCSPGFIMNWQTLKPKFLIEELIIDEKIKVLDILDEVYYQMKKDSEDGFLKSDASAIILEVLPNAILQV